MVNDALGRIEAIVDATAVAPGVEALLPHSARPRQLRVRTLLVGILLALADHRPGHLTRVHRALVSLADDERWRLGVVVQWKAGPHVLTYRQIEHTFALVVGALTKEQPDGAPCEQLSAVVDALVEASVPVAFKGASSSLAVDWSDHESFAAPPPKHGGACADPEATWGHRRGGPSRGELFFGYFFQAATMVRDEGGEAVPELVRRMLVTTCAADPPPALVTVLERLVHSGVVLGDVLCDSGYAHRLAEHWALPLRRLGASLVMDLHPHDRGTRGTFGGAIAFNGNLYCPATPPTLFDLDPLARGASAEESATHDRRAAELARYKLGRATTDDDDGYHRVTCPATIGKVRCPTKATSMALAFDRPEVVAPPQAGPKCCIQQTITVPPEVNAKTAQKHDYPSAAHRRSYARRTGVERSYATMKDPASTDVTRGWCRIMGLCGVTLFLACGVVVRNLRILDAFQARQVEDARRAAAGSPRRPDAAGAGRSTTSWSRRQPTLPHRRAALPARQRGRCLHARLSKAWVRRISRIRPITAKCEDDTASNVKTSQRARRDSNPQPSDP